MSQSLIAFDTDHIKSFVFGTSKLKEIRGASSILDRLNRESTVQEADKVNATCIYANGGSALFLVEADDPEHVVDKAEQLGRVVQKLYHERSSGGASITYAIQPIPDTRVSDIMNAEDLGQGITMKQILDLLRMRLNIAKDSLQINSFQNKDVEEAGSEEYIVVPSHVFLAPCSSCGLAYAQDTSRDNADPDEIEGRYCTSCIKKREEDSSIKDQLEHVRATKLSEKTLWSRLLKAMATPNDLHTQPYDIPPVLKRPKDFDAFRAFSKGKDYLGLIYADGNGMGKAIANIKTLAEMREFANTVDNAVFGAMADAIRSHLSVQDDTLPFDILLIGGDDVVVVVPADKALQVAHTLTERFHVLTERKYTLSASVVLAPVKYPFNLQRQLASDILKAAKKSGSTQKTSADPLDQARIDFLVVTGNLGLNYSKIHAGMYRKKVTSQHTEEFYATMRPYTPKDFEQLLHQIKAGNEIRLGRTKLHQLREAILKRNNTTTILESLLLLRNWRKTERDFIKELVKIAGPDQPAQPQHQGITFPWYIDTQSRKGQTIYRTPLLDFIELYDFVSS